MNSGSSLNASNIRFTSYQQNMNSDSENQYKIPSLYIPDNDLDESIDGWKFSLIGRLDLVKLKFATAEEELRKQWITKGKFQLIPIGKGVFVIKLENEIDIKYIWNGYCMVKSHVLKLRLWESNFNPAAQKSTTTFVWVNFPGFGIEYWKEKMLMSMGDAIGRAIKVDDTTLKREVGYYASVLVEVDLARTVPHQIVVNSKYGSFEQEVQIPKLPKFCSHCKVVGHLVTECKVLRKEDAQKVEENDYNYAIPKKVCRIKEKPVPQPIGFDICGTPTKNISKNDANDLFSDDEIVDAIIPPVENSLVQHNDPGSQNSGKFHILQNFINDDFPPISVNKLLDVTSSSSSAVNSIIVEAEKKMPVKEVVKKIVKPKPISLITTRKQNTTLNLVKEKKKGMRSPGPSQPSIF
ncbi:uncharacterized protein LOC113273136 [Papaver somniferum]|uniref:uncharacterized protein LOC113273136 n=1 Tax=Papaver somniferum TaxID=3469 RepID=UPI000E704E97|nr:uncharacterized protein LOC113273136 [Papaver somniferum]